MITSSRQSKHTHALVYGVHRAIYITAYIRVANTISLSRSHSKAAVFGTQCINCLYALYCIVFCYMINRNALL